MVDPNLHRQITLPTTSSQPVLPLPEKIGPYKIEALLEKGGMSTLYLATHPDTKEPITIKALFPEFASNPDMVQRFLREAEIIEMADHPNIVKLYGQGEWENGLYIAMEFIQGVSLRQYLLKNLISLKNAVDIVMEIAMALCHLHAHGVIHRDLKPENILITESGNIKVIDFGISQLLTKSNGIDPAQKKRLIGTPIYMSPEQRENPESTSYPADIYSLGIITYEVILGKLSHGQIHLALMPKGIHKILTKALQAKVEDRYQDIVDFMNDLNSYMHSPALAKENKESAPLSDLSENLKHAQQHLIPQNSPQWPQCTTAFATYKSTSFSNLFYDFIELSPQTYGIVMGEPSMKGTPSLVYTSVLRGMTRALTQLTQKPEEIALALNSLLLEDPMKQAFSLSYLLLFPEENLFRFISCGCGHLWYLKNNSKKADSIVSNQQVLGVNPKAEFTQIQHPWMPGDTLIFSGCIEAKDDKEILLPNEEQFSSWIEEIAQATPQEQVDYLIRKIKITLRQATNDESVFIFSIKRL